MIYTLRTDQQELKNSIYKSWETGNKNVLGVLSTGGGKTVITGDIVQDGLNQGMNQAIIAHRNELVSQMSMHIASRGISHRVIGSNKTIQSITRSHYNKFGQSFVNPSSPTGVIGVDTLIARRKSLTDWCKNIDRWKIDEAHHVLRENKWGKAIELLPNAVGGLGVTATPKRADGNGLGRWADGVFDDMRIGWDMRKLINIGALSEYQIVCPRSDLVVDDVKLSANGDWSTAKLKKAAKESRIVGDAVDAYKTYSAGKQAICFATDVETAGDIARKFNDNGITAVALSGKTPSAYRENCVQKFRNGQLTVLVNVDLFDEGFDVPACETVIMARPTASLGKYRQMVGRALRAFAGKPYGLIIDLVSNVIRHGLPDKAIEWSLDRTEKRGSSKRDPDEIPLRECDGCARPYERRLIACPYCGVEPPLPSGNIRSIEQVDGDLILLDAEKLAQMRQATAVKDPQTLADSVHMAAGAIAAKRALNIQTAKVQAHNDLKETIAQWAAIERLNGFNDRELYKMFYLKSGVDLLTALDGSKTVAEIEKTMSQVKGWYNGK